MALLGDSRDFIEICKMLRAVPKWNFCCSMGKKKGLNLYVFSYIKFKLLEE